MREHCGVISEVKKISQYELTVLNVVVQKQAMYFTNIKHVYHEEC